MAALTVRAYGSILGRCSDPLSGATVFQLLHIMAMLVRILVWRGRWVFGPSVLFFVLRSLVLWRRRLMPARANQLAADAIRHLEIEMPNEDAGLVLDGAEGVLAGDVALTHATTRFVHGRFWRALVHDARAKINCTVDTPAQRLVVRRHMVERATARGVRKDHIARNIDLCVVAAFIPTPEAILAAQVEQSYVARTRRDLAGRSYLPPLLASLETVWNWMVPCESVRAV